MGFRGLMKPLKFELNFIYYVHFFLEIGSGFHQSQRDDQAKS